LRRVGDLEEQAGACENRALAVAGGAFFAALARGTPLPATTDPAKLQAWVERLARDGLHPLPPRDASALARAPAFALSLGATVEQIKPAAADELWPTPPSLATVPGTAAAAACK